MPMSDKVMAAALRLLNFRWYTESELIDRLNRKGFESDEINNVMTELKSLGYVDDKRFVDQWVSQRKRLKPMGKIRIKHELQAKGVQREVVDKVLEEMLPQIEEHDIALSLADKKLKKNPRIEWRKLAAFLTRRGFSWEIVSRVGRELDINNQK